MCMVCMRGVVFVCVCRVLMKRLAPHLADTRVAEAFQAIDADESGGLDFDEFSAWYPCCRP